MDWWQTIITALASIIGGAFTFLGVFITIRAQQKRESKIEKPNLEIIDFKEVHSYDNTEKSDLGVFVKFLKIENVHKDISDKQKWVCVEYTLKNIGKSEIMDLCIVTLFKQNTRLYAVEGDPNYIRSNQDGKNLAVMCRKFIKPQAVFKLKICYFEYAVDSAENSLTPSTALWLFNGEKNAWRQLLFAPDNLIKGSEELSMKRYFKEISYDNYKVNYKKWKKRYKHTYKKTINKNGS